MRIAALIIPLTLSSAAAFAHDAWIVASGSDDYHLVYGHPGELESYDPAKVEGLSAYDKNGNARDVSSSVRDGKVEISTGPDIALIAVEFDNGFWTENMDKKYANKPKWEIGDSRSSSHSKKFNKNLLAWSSAFSKPLGTELEIVPLANPLQLKPGDKLPVQVLYRSQPLADADIEIMGNKEVYPTDAKGRASVPIQQTDYQYIAVSHKVDTKSNPNADQMSLSANLVFTP
ncbi:MAG: DUF4198 domain-containing protein [Gammaproteobacteria bacterium]|nr:DUF4198 domain-containing protein [Gammaproteobacteria bacterium]